MKGNYLVPYKKLATTNNNNNLGKSAKSVCIHMAISNYQHTSRLVDTGHTYQGDFQRFTLRIYCYNL